MVMDNTQSRQRLLIRKVRRIRLKDHTPATAPTGTAGAREKGNTKSAEELKKEKLAKQQESRRKNLQMMMQLQMQSAAEEEAARS